MNGTSEWFVIINPKAGDQKGLHDWDKISALLKANDIQFDHRFTDFAHHALSLVPELVTKGYRKFIVVGGDGFLNEVVNGIFSQDKVPTGDIMLGLIPVGTGNDWVRTFHIPNDYEGAVKVIVKGKTIMHDVGRVYYHWGPQEDSRYFINICGLGFDAEVAKKVNNDSGYEHTGPLKYQYHIFTSLVTYQTVPVVLKIDGESRIHELFTMTVGICQYNGGGMKQLPYAVPDDGIFDISLIGKISRMKVIRNVKHLYDGSFVNLPEVKTFTGKNITIESNPETWIEVDGESLGHTPFRFEMLPQALKVIIA
jgi:YegS/Rv2252/BmrU family lipid kinase